jgi:protein-disulfide isomerase
VNWGTLRPRLGLVVRVALGAIWIWASWDKLHDPRQFVRAVRAYDATPEWLTKGIGYGLPVLEISIGILLILGLTTRVVASISAGLFAIFLIGILQAWMRGLKLECGCFGGGGLTGETHYPLDVLRDLGLLALAVYLVLYPVTWLSFDERRDAADAVPELTVRQQRSARNVQRYNQLVAARRRASRSRDTFLISSLAVIVAAIVITGMGVQAQRAGVGGSLVATHADAENGVTVGSAKAPVTVDVYEDFQCPLCNDFEQENGPTITTLITDGKISVNYHTMAFLDSSSNGNRYSSRAANAALCASDENASVFLTFHATLYGKDSAGNNNQPAEGTSGRSDDALIAFGTTAGVTGASTFSSCVQGETHKALVEAITDEASKKGVNGTPTFFIDGKQFTADKSKFIGTLTDAITKALAAGKSAVPYVSPTPTATPSDTSTDIPSVVAS